MKETGENCLIILFEQLQSLVRSTPGAIFSNPRQKYYNHNPTLLPVYPQTQGFQNVLKWPTLEIKVGICDN